MIPMDPRPHTLRDVWEMACGRWDAEVASRGFWLTMLGGKPTAAQLADMHPLRRPGGEKPAAGPADLVALTLDRLFGG